MPKLFDERETKSRAELMGRAVRSKMETFGWTQTYFADLLGVSQARVSEYLNGERIHSGKGPQSQASGWPVEWVRRLEQTMTMPAGTLFREGGYVPKEDIRSLAVSASTIEQLVQNSMDIEEGAKPAIMAAVRASRRPMKAVGN